MRSGSMKPFTRFAVILLLITYCGGATNKSKGKQRADRRTTGDTPESTGTASSNSSGKSRILRTLTSCTRNSKADLAASDATENSRSVAASSKAVKTVSSAPPKKKRILSFASGRKTVEKPTKCTVYVELICTELSTGAVKSRQFIDITADQPLDLGSILAEARRQLQIQHGVSLTDYRDPSPLITANVDTRLAETSLAFTLKSMFYKININVALWRIDLKSDSRVCKVSLSDTSTMTLAELEDDCAEQVAKQLPTYGTGIAYQLSLSVDGITIDDYEPAIDILMKHGRAVKGELMRKTWLAVEMDVKLYNYTRDDPIETTCVYRTSPQTSDVFHRIRFKCLTYLQTKRVIESRDDYLYFAENLFYVQKLKTGQLAEFPYVQRPGAVTTNWLEGRRLQLHYGRKVPIYHNGRLWGPSEVLPDTTVDQLRRRVGAAGQLAVVYEGQPAADGRHHFVTDNLYQALVGLTEPHIVFQEIRNIPRGDNDPIVL